MKSMTGFGRAKTLRDDLDVDIEIKSINGRYLDLRMYLPRDLSFYEYQIRKEVSSRINRGTVEIRATFTDHREPKIRLNQPKLTKYHSLIKEAQSILGLSSDVPMELLINEPGVIESQNAMDEDPMMLDLLNETLRLALSRLEESLSNEADNICATLCASMDEIESALQRVEDEIQPYKESLFANMQERIREILKTNQAENLEQRLFQELAIYIDRYDIHEELSRLRSHIGTLRTTLTSKDDNGKSLNFILQEMQREANTLGSKFSTASTFPSILLIKEQIEKCREIVQNVA